MAADLTFREAAPGIPPSDTVALDPEHSRPSAAVIARKPSRRRAGHTGSRLKWLIPTLYILFLLVPIYWLINMSFKTNAEITSRFTLWPDNPTLNNYAVIFTDPSWYNGYINSIIYVVLTRSSRSLWRCRRPTRSPVTGSSATSTCSSGY